MKKLIFVLFVIGACFKGFSQDDYEDEDDYVEEKFGVRAGANLSSLRFGDSPKIFENKSNIGVAFGFFSEIDLSERFVFAPEAQFSAEGSREQRLRFDYIHIPLAFKYKIREIFAVVGGPVGSVKVNRYSDDLRPVSSYSIKYLREKDYNYLAFSAMLGVEATFWDPFFANFRCYYGITDVFSEEYLLGATNTNFQLGVGVKF